MRNSENIRPAQKRRILFNVVPAWRFFTKRLSFAAQCHRCQCLGHGSTNCNLTPKCVKSGEKHLSNECGLPKKAELNDGNKSQLKCDNCGGSHTANYRGCSTRKSHHEAQEQRKKKSAGNSTHRKPLTDFPNINRSTPVANLQPERPMRIRLNPTGSRATQPSDLFTITEFLSLARGMFSRLKE